MACLKLLDIFRFLDAKKDKSSSTRKLFPPLEAIGVTDDFFKKKLPIRKNSIQRIVS